MFSQKSFVNSSPDDANVNVCCGVNQEDAMGSPYAVCMRRAPEAIVDSAVGRWPATFSHSTKAFKSSTIVSRAD